MNCEEIHPLLAGYVDDEISSDERAIVEEHIAACPACKAELDDQLAAVKAYAAYPMGEPSAAEWQQMWRKVGARLPSGATRINLESLAEIDIGGEFVTEIEEESPPATKSRPLPTPVSRTRKAGEGPAARPVRLSDADSEELLFKPVRVVRQRGLGWAHAVGIAASILIMFLVWLSVKPVIHADQMATVSEVELEYDGGEANSPIIMVLRSSEGENIPLIWIAQSTKPDDTSQEERIQ